jgi:hypothetical protein
MRKAKTTEQKLDDSQKWVIEHSDVISDVVISRIERRSFPPSRGFLKKVLGPLIERARKAGRFDVRVEKSPWDTSSYPEPTGEACAFHSYDMVADFLDEPNGNTIPTYMSGSGMAVETYRKLLEEAVSSEFHRWVFSWIKNFRNDLLADLSYPPSVLEMSDDDFWRCILDEFSDRYADEMVDFNLVEQIEGMRFLDVVRIVNPRMLFDIEASKSLFDISGSPERPN